MDGWPSACYKEKKEQIENNGPIKGMHSLKDVVMITFSP